MSNRSLVELTAALADCRRERDDARRIIQLIEDAIGDDSRDDAEVRRAIRRLTAGSPVVAAALAAPAAQPQAEPAWMAAFDQARDDILRDRGALEGLGLTNEQTNAVLSILDAHFMPHLHRAAAPAQPQAEPAESVRLRPPDEPDWRRIEAAWASDAKALAAAPAQPAEAQAAAEEKRDA